MRTTWRLRGDLRQNRRSGSDSQGSRADRRGLQEAAPIAGIAGQRHCRLVEALHQLFDMPGDERPGAIEVLTDSWTLVPMLDCAFVTGEARQITTE